MDEESNVNLEKVRKNCELVLNFSKLCVHVYFKINFQKITTIFKSVHNIFESQIIVVNLSSRLLHRTIQIWLIIRISQVNLKTSL